MRYFSRIVSAGLRVLPAGERLALLRQLRNEIAARELSGADYYRLDEDHRELGSRRAAHIHRIQATCQEAADEVRGWSTGTYVQRDRDGLDVLGPRIEVVIEVLERSLEETARLRALITVGDMLDAELHPGRTARVIRERDEERQAKP
jgi:hypothetical protein